jgi:hypothetical protein
MDDEKKIDPRIIYGNSRMSVQNPMVSGVIVGPPDPTLWDYVRFFVYEIIVPAFLFALAFAACVTLIRF